MKNPTKEKHDGIFNVRDYGAIGDGINNDKPAIQEAIDTAAEIAKAGNRGGVIFVPPGEYRLEQGLVIPRNARANIPNIRIVGSGAGQAVLRSRYLPSDEPVLSFSIEASGVEHFGIENLSIVRSDIAGLVFSYPAPDNARLRRGVFRNVEFKGPSFSGEGNDTAYDCVKIEHGHELVFDNVSIAGGKSGLNLEQCSRVTANRLHTLMDGDCDTGVRIDGGGSMLFTDLRIEAVETSCIELNIAKNITFINPSFEGKRERQYFHMKSSSGIRVVGGACPQPPWTKGGWNHKRWAAPDYPQFAVWIDNNCHDISFDGTYFSAFEYAVSGSRSIFVESGARYIRFRDVHGTIRQQGDIEFEPESDATLFGTRAAGNQLLRIGLPLGNAVAFGNVRVRDIDNIRITGDHLTNLTDGHTGQVVTLIFDDNIQLQRTGNLRFAGNPSEPYQAPIGTVLRFFCDGSKWHELSRSENV